ncbi:hypothetical protein D3C77_362500 [compost metagenome]
MQLTDSRLHPPGQRLVNGVARAALLVGGLHHGAQQAQLFNKGALAVPRCVQAVMPCLACTIQLHLVTFPGRLVYPVRWLERKL